MVRVRQADDRAIKAEGLENLTEGELREACRARGIRGNVFGEGAPAFMRRKLADWLELSLNRCAISGHHHHRLVMPPPGRVLSDRVQACVGARTATSIAAIVTRRA